MSEEEIIKRLKNVIELNKSFLDCTIKENSNIYKDIQGLLDLYNKEKEKNKKIEETVKKGMKNLWIDTCAEDAGKYSAYMSIREILEE